MPKTEFENALTKACSEPQARLSHIAFQIIQLSHTLNKKILITHKYQLSITHKTEKDANTYQENLCQLFMMMPIRYFYPTYICYAAPDLHQKKMSVLMEAASEKLKALPLKAFDAEYEALFSLEVSENHSKNEPFNRLLGCEYLLMSYADLHFKELPIIEREKFLKARAVPLYTKIIAILEQRSDLSHQRDLIDLYTRVRDRFTAPILETDPFPILMHPQAPSSPKASQSAPSPPAEKSRSVPERKGPG